MGSVVGSMNNVKIFILYLMQNVGYPLDFVSINDIIMQTDYVMYLDFAVAFNEMLDAGQKKFMKAMKKFPSVIRTEYALALLFENDADRAQSLLNDFEKIAKSYPYKPDIEGERTLINMAKKKYEERCNLSDKNPCI